MCKNKESELARSQFGFFVTDGGHGNTKTSRQVYISCHFANPNFHNGHVMHRMLDVTARAVIAYLNAQIDAGAQAVMVFDSWGGVLEHRAFHAFSLAYTQRVLNQLKREHHGVRIPAIVFTKGGGLWLEQIADTGARLTVVELRADLAGAHPGFEVTLDAAALQACPENTVKTRLFHARKKLTNCLRLLLQREGGDHLAGAAS